MLSSIMVGVGAVVLRGIPLAASGCEKAEQQPDRQEVLRQTVSLVMLPTFAQLSAQTATLAVSATALASGPSVDAIAKTRAAWRDARGTWKRSEAFLIGPSDDLSVTAGAIDSWPAAGAKIDALIAGLDPVDETAITTMSANLRGFPAIEYLLFEVAAGEDAPNKRLLTDALALRRRTLVVSLCADLAKKCRALSDAWSASDGYGTALAEAGHGSKVFPAQREGIDKVITAMLSLAELMTLAKLAKPLGLDTGAAVRPDLEEAARSDTSLAWIEQNLVGLLAVYECRLGDSAGKSLGAEVAAMTPAADRLFRDALTKALAEVRAITSPMRVLLAGDRASLTSLHAAVQAVKRSIATDVASALGASIGFGYSDSD